MTDPQLLAYVARIANALERLSAAAEMLFDEVEEDVVATQRKLAAGIPEGIQWS